MYRVWKLSDTSEGERMQELSAFNSYENALSLMQSQHTLALVLQEANNAHAGIVYTDGLLLLHVWNGHREIQLPSSLVSPTEERYV